MTISLIVWILSPYDYLPDFIQPIVGVMERK
ncbi:DUF1232 domain-containing protein [Anaerobacillus sp. HL2]|nr:DUF1232 domain-containing protein [Anaerobacillus sp. HL2]